MTKIVEVEKVVTATPEPPKEPKVGGTLVISYAGEPATLDIHHSNFAGREFMHLGATLVAKDPKTGEYLPYLAESWEVSEDGLAWDFTLRKDVKFHDGTPLTAHDYAWTFQRALDPETKSPAAGSTFASIASAEAVDDYTLRLTLYQPFFPLLENLELGFAQPLSKAAVEKWGEQYGRNPVGVGPYKFKEWVTGEKVILERNPDYNWAPPFLHQGPAYIETIEWRYIPEYATQIAGLEAGEIDHIEYVLSKDVQRLIDSGKVQMFEAYNGGMRPYVTLNVSQPPFDDLKVRQAFNLAVDREAVIKVIADGAGVPQYGPIAHVTHGYWPGVEYIGYKYNLDKAKALMAEAGYTVGSSGVLEKDGQPLKVVLKTQPVDPYDKLAEVLQQQYKALDVDVEIEQKEYGAVAADLMGGTYQASVAGYDYTEFFVVWVFFHSSNIGALNFIRMDDPELDALLDATNYETDPDKRQEACNEAQRRIVEQAYVVPLFTPTVFLPMSSRVQGASLDTFSATGNRLYVNDLWIED